MRGVFLQEQLEFRLEVEGEEWRQDDSVSGKLVVKNHAASPQTLGGLYVHLAQGNNKKVKQKTEGALVVLSSADFDAKEALEPQKQISFDWSFPLNINCMVSCKAQSLYFVCGKKEAEAAGHLPITVHPHQHIQSFVSMLENSFSFVFKGYKWKKDWVEAKLKPPHGLHYTTLEYLTMCFNFADDELNLIYRFHIKGLEATESTLGVKKSKREAKQTLAASNYLIGGTQMNYDYLEKQIKEALSDVESKFV